MATSKMLLRILHDIFCAMCEEAHLENINFSVEDAAIKEQFDKALGTITSGRRGTQRSYGLFWNGTDKKYIYTIHVRTKPIDLTVCDCYNIICETQIRRTAKSGHTEFWYSKKQAWH